MNLKTMIRGAVWRVACLLPLNLLIGCAALRPTPTPIPQRWYVEPQAGHSTLLVFLPGIRDDVEDFARRSFVDAVRERDLAADMVAVDTHIGYFRAGTVTERLREDVLLPARQRGYDRLVMVGISLGGLGSLLTTEAHPQEVDGLILLAPFLGEREVIEEIAAAGGAAAWQPGELDPDDYQRHLWAWLRQAELPPTVLACGRDDRFVDACRLLAARLPEEAFLTTPGGHDWVAWKTLWERILDEDDLPCADVLTSTSGG